MTRIVNRVPTLRTPDPEQQAWAVWILALMIHETVMQDVRNAVDTASPPVRIDRNNKPMKQPGQEWPNKYGLPAIAVCAGIAFGCGLVQFAIYLWGVIA